MKTREFFGYVRYTFFAILFLLLFHAPSGAEKLPEINIGIVMDGRWEQGEATLTIAQKEIIEITHGEFDVQFPPGSIIFGDWTLESIHTGLKKLLERKSAAERIEHRIRTALHTAGASFAAIQQLRLAKETAYKNLDLVFTSYSRGAVSIIELIDAQNAALIADQSASNAVYDFLIDVMEMERAVGKFDLFRSHDERESFFKRLEDYYREIENHNKQN